MIQKLLHPKTIPLFLILLIINLILISAQFHASTGDSIIKHWFFAAITPFHALIGEIRFTIDSWSKYFSEMESLQKENIRLQEQIELLKFDQKLLDDQMARSSSMEKLLHLLLAYEQGGVVCEVVSRSFSVWDQTMIIRGGEEEELLPEYPVLQSDGIFGFILRCDSHFSEVMLITNPGFSMAARIQDTEIRGIIHGTGDLLVKLDYVNISAPVRVNDVVMSSGEDGIFPPDFLIGHVVQIKKPGSVFQNLLVKPSADITGQRFVLVLQKTGRHLE